MAESCYLDAEVPVLLSRANYDRTRRRFYLLSGMDRNDSALPKLVPPGATQVRRRDADQPAFDTAVPSTWWAPATTRTVARTREICPPQILRHGELPRGCRTETYSETVQAWDGTARLEQWMTAIDYTAGIAAAQALAAQSAGGNPGYRITGPSHRASLEAALAGAVERIAIRVLDERGADMTARVEPQRS